MLFVAYLNGAQPASPNSSSGAGTCTVSLSGDEATAKISLSFHALSSTETEAHIHGPAMHGSAGPTLFTLPFGEISDYQINLSPAQAQWLKSGLLYLDIHTGNFKDGELRGQIVPATTTTLQFGSANYSATESAGSVAITVTRFGDSSGVSTVDYATNDETARQGYGYNFAAGTLRFEPNETIKTFNILLSDSNYLEGDRTLSLKLSNPSAAALGVVNAATLTIKDDDSVQPASNPIDQQQFFVRQHYLDFLNREADTGGLSYWANEIKRCGSDPACIHKRRITVSAAFFIETEFQETGFFIYRLYKAAYGARPAYFDFLKDRSRLIAGVDLESNKTSLANDFTQREAFKLLYADTLAPEEFVNKIFDTANLKPYTEERQFYINLLRSGGTRAQVLLGLIELAEFKQREYNAAFVLMQYFGYLRREPDEEGLRFWLDVLNDKVNGDYRAMVCAFITSAEYQSRFSPVLTHSNTDCGP